MDVIATARELGKTIQQDERYIKLALMQQQNDADTELQSLIGEFNLKRIDLNNEINKTEKEQDKITALNDQIKEIYGKIMANKNMNDYNSAKNELDALMDFVLQILRGSVNGENPDTIQQKTDCSGGCSSCSGCH
ncbi:YlbF family regulator [Oscillospiraceae bacterium PP1C4]